MKAPPRQGGRTCPERLENKIALITGAGSGIGRACALRFASEGAKVCAADLDQSAATETARQVEAAGGKALALRTDTTDEAANEAMVAACVKAFGAVDVLVAAAGVGSARPDPASAKPYTMLDIPTERFRAVIDVNLYGVLYSNRAVARWMVANRRGGSLINLGSIMSKMPSAGGAYSVSKAGVWMATKCLAQELARHNIRVNAIGPGFIETPMTARAARRRRPQPLGHEPHADGPLRHGGGDREHRALPRLGRRGLLHRRDPAPLRRRLRGLAPTPTPHPALSPRGREGESSAALTLSPQGRGQGEGSA